MVIFDSNKYRAIISGRVKLFPKKGHGQYAKLANFIGVHTTLLSQILHGAKDLTVEQAAKACEFFGFTKLETKYFIGLVRWERAGTQQLKNIIYEELEEIRNQSLDLAKRIPNIEKLSESDEAIFYSNWYYMAVKLLTSIDGFNDVESISQKLNVPRKTVIHVLEFLVRCRLCVAENGLYKMGPQRTHVAADSPLVARHHINWRLKNMEKLNSISSDEIVYTSPVTISRGDAKVIRKKIVEFIEEFSAKVVASGSEEFFVLNIDWLGLK